MNVNNFAFETVVCKIEKNDEDFQGDEKIVNIHDQKDFHQEHPIDIDEIKLEELEQNSTIPDDNADLPGTENKHEKNFKTSKRKEPSLHVEIDTVKTPYTCNVCSSTFLHKFSLTSHELIHMREKPYACKKCPAKFSREGFLNNHMTVHTGEKPHICHVCSLSFRTKRIFTKHLLDHKEKSYSCNVCSSSFHDELQLQVHSVIHSTDKPFSCNVCSLKFREERHLRNHRRCHLDNKL